MTDKNLAWIARGTTSGWSPDGMTYVSASLAVSSSVPSSIASLSRAPGAGFSLALRHEGSVQIRRESKLKSRNAELNFGEPGSDPTETAEKI